MPGDLGHRVSKSSPERRLVGGTSLGERISADAVIMLVSCEDAGRVP
ncbi:hypothetical protein TOK_2011 [Pseudonocardia sp. N23]|nr:hypothetical protein TOK_2011 [Pseudonocardia sp. N23]